MTLTEEINVKVGGLERMEIYWLRIPRGLEQYTKSNGKFDTNVPL